MTRSPLIAVPPYHVQGTAAANEAGFPRFAHHESVAALWEQKWREPCELGIYPFTDGNIEDFTPIFADLVRLSGDEPDILYRPDEYARPFFPVAENLLARAEQAEARKDVSDARRLYLRAAAVFRMARFPINRSPVSEDAWRRGKAAYIKGARSLDPPSVPVDIPFTHADRASDDDTGPIQAFLRVPKGQTPANGWPVLLFICGLDAYKTDHTDRTQRHVESGFATLSFEIPGTGDCPAAPSDPASPDRLIRSILDWVASEASGYAFNVAKIAARGVSTGGYYALRAAHTHADRLFAAVAQGAACHHVFDAAWIGVQDQMEYPFALAEALAYKFGFRDADPVAAYMAGACKFSLLESGVLDRPSCRMLIINGMEDSIFPIEDSLIAGLHGKNKDVIARGNRSHMGDPGADDILFRWIDDAIAGKL